MASYTISPIWGAGAQLFDNSGNVLTGGKIYTYYAGSTTPLTTYTNPIGTVANTNPIIANSAGRLTNEIWFPVSGSYKFVLKDANDVLIATYDNIPTTPQPPIVNDASSISYETGYIVNAGNFTIGATYLITSVGTTDFVAIGAAANVTGILFTATGVGSGTGTAEYSRTVQSKLREVVSVEDFGAVGDGATNNIKAFVAAAASLNDGDSLFIPDGDYIFDFSTYTVASPVYPTQGIIGLANKKDITIYGTGAKLRITNLDTQSKGGWSIIALEECSNIVISGLNFDLRGVLGSTPAPEPDYPIISCIFAVGDTWENLNVNNCKFTSYNPLGAAPEPSPNNFNYKQIPIYVDGDTNADVVRGFTFTNNTVGDGVSDMNTYKMFLLGVGGVNISNNKFLNICGIYPTIRYLIHASRGAVIDGNYFEGLDPANDNPSVNIESTDTPQMVQIANEFGKGGGAVSISNNTFALTGSGGINFDDAKGASICGNIFYDRVDMSSILTIENNPASCVFLTNGAWDVVVNNNVVSGTVTRKFAHALSAVNGSISYNKLDSAAGYAIKVTSAPNFTIEANDIADVSELSSAQVGILIDSTLANLAATQCIICKDNIIHNFSGASAYGIGTVNYNPNTVFFANNKINSVTNAYTSGVGEQYSANWYKFQNDSAVLSSSANVLDWYEEGTFTPIVYGSTTAGVGTYTTQVGKFTRIGDVVNFQISVVWSAHTGTGNTIVGTLPYNAESTSGELMVLSIIQNGGPVPAAGSIRVALITPNSDVIGLREQVLANMSITNSNAITGTGAIYISGTYKV